MSNRVPPSFPHPFSVGSESSYPAQDAAGTPEQRSIDPAQVFAYPPDSVFTRTAIGTSLDTPYWSQPQFPVQSHGITPNLMPILNAPPRRLSPHIPPYQPMNLSDLRNFWWLSYKWHTDSVIRKNLPR
ncbi:hypothetical protein H4582DRAFT_2071462 [Lactarius indigo]|nr:hypothetical protein H4582DRAFT_2071462 [Lactarius indigo]